MGPTTRAAATVPEFGARLDGMVYIERPGVYAVIEDNDKQIALIETRHGYFLPGGGIDFGERELEALKREIMEETGYQVSVVEEIGEAVEYIKASIDQKSYRIHSKFFKARLGSKVREGIEEDHRLVWLARGDAIKLLLRQGQVWAVQRVAKE